MAQGLEELFNHAPSPMERIDHPIAQAADVQLWIKRDEQLCLGRDKAFCGNKWRKMAYNLLEARKLGHSKLLTFGGAFSNHITAVAAAGEYFGLETIGIIRGEELSAESNASLKLASDCGMQLHFISRSDYRKKHTPEFLTQLREKHGTFYHLPEGGTNSLALKGCAAIAVEVEKQLEFLPDYYCLSMGTGGTAAGLISGLNGKSKVLVLPALSGDFMYMELHRLLQNADRNHLTNWSILPDFHMGGYANMNTILWEFIQQFERHTSILLDPIYTAKLFYGLFHLLESGYFPRGSRIVAIHTGGLQGRKGFGLF